MKNLFGRKNDNGTVTVFNQNGEIATRIDANIYPIDSELSAKHEHANGITITLSDAKKIGLSIE